MAEIHSFHTHCCLWEFSWNNVFLNSSHKHETFFWLWSCLFIRITQSPLLHFYERHRDNKVQLFFSLQLQSCIPKSKTTSQCGSFRRAFQLAQNISLALSPPGFHRYITLLANRMCISSTQYFWKEYCLMCLTGLTTIMTKHFLTAACSVKALKCPCLVLLISTVCLSRANLTLGLEYRGTDTFFK